MESTPRPGYVLLPPLQLLQQQQQQYQQQQFQMQLPFYHQLPQQQALPQQQQQMVAPRLFFVPFQGALRLAPPTPSMHLIGGGFSGLLPNLSGLSLPSLYPAFGAASATSGWDQNGHFSSPSSASASLVGTPSDGAQPFFSPPSPPALQKRYSSEASSASSPVMCSPSNREQKETTPGSGGGGCGSSGCGEQKKPSPKPTLDIKARVVKRRRRRTALPGSNNKVVLTSRMRASCDSCTDLKVKCQKVEESECCEKCFRLGVPCVFSPQRKRGPPTSKGRAVCLNVSESFREPNPQYEPAEKKVKLPENHNNV